MDIADQLAEAYAAGYRAGAAIDDETYTKSEVDYREADDAKRRCGTCEHYDDGSCDIVLGDIDPEDVCDRFDAARDPAADSGDRPDRRNRDTHAVRQDS